MCHGLSGSKNLSNPVPAERMRPQLGGPPGLRAQDAESEKGTAHLI